MPRQDFGTYRMVGVFKYFIFGEDFHFDEHLFQMRWFNMLVGTTKETHSRTALTLEKSENSL